MDQCLDSNTIGTNAVFNYCLINKIKLIYSATSASLGNRGKDMRIKDYVNFLIKKLKLKVKIQYDNKKPDGVFRKVLDINLAKKYGGKSKISLEKGFDITYKDFVKNYKKN